MYNTFVYNSQLYNAPNNLYALSGQDKIVFNGYSLQNAEIISNTLLQDSTPERDFQVNNIPRGDGQFVIGDYWRVKKLTVKGELKKATNSLLEAEIDNMKKALAVPEANLDIKIDGVIRRYKATLTNGQNIFNQRRHFHITFIPFDLEFTCVEPYGHSVEYNAITLLTQTFTLLNEQIDNIGTIRAKPVLILNFTAASGITGINFKNNTRSEEIEVIKNIQAGDYVRFDSENLEVQINGQVYDYDGSFPLLDTDSNSVTITLLGGGTATYDYTAKYLIPYL